MIEVNNLCKSFTRVVKDNTSKKKSKFTKLKTKKEDFLAVNNITFKAKDGEILGILGPNGAGKTTLLRMLGGILTPTSGNISVAGYDYSIDKNAAKKEIGYLSGNTKLYNRLSPRELLTTFASLYEMPKESIEKSLEQVIDIMDMK
ncbi:MAG: ATP-binding cassette domain-containing protein, partial [Erysipelotrichaceae bacterium]